MISAAFDCRRSRGDEMQGRCVPLLAMTSWGRHARECDLVSAFSRQFRLLYFTMRRDFAAMISTAGRLCDMASVAKRRSRRMARRAARLAGLMITPI